MPPLPVAGREGVRQTGQPLAQQRVDPRRRQPVGQPLHPRGVRAAQDAVVERFERDAPLRQLPLQVLVPVDAQLGVVREGSSGSPSPSSRRATDRAPRSSGCGDAPCAAPAPSPAPARRRARPRPRSTAADTPASARPCARRTGTTRRRCRCVRRNARSPPRSAASAAPSAPTTASASPGAAEEVRHARPPLQQRQVDVQVHPVRRQLLLPLVLPHLRMLPACLRKIVPTFVEVGAPSGPTLRSP